jgi:valyl-tRNA synthetase
MIDLDKEKKRIAGELEKARGDLARTETKLNSDFAQKAPQEVVNKERERASATRERIVKLQDQLKSLGT